MKLNRLFLLAAMGLGLFACNDNDLVEGSAPNGTQEEGTTYVGLSLKFSNTSSRATGDQPIDGTENEGEGNEGLIKDVRIVVTDENDNLQYNNAITAVKNNDQEDIYIFTIQPGKKKFYAVINGNALNLNANKELETWKGGKLPLTKKAAELYNYNASATGGNGFLMSSTAVVEQTIQDKVSKEEVKAGTANNVEITVERAVAKVTMKLGESIDFSKQTATLKNLSCQIGNADNLEYNKDGEDNAAKYKTAGTYLMAYNNNNVRETPYFNYPDASMNWEDFSQDKLLDPTAQTIYTDGQATSTPTARFYCLENTHANGEGAKNYLQGNTTFIRVKADMIPNSAKTFTYTPATGEGGATPASVAIADKEETGWPTSLETFYVITDAPEQTNQGSYVFASDLAELYGNEAGDITKGGETEVDKKAAAVITALANYGYHFTNPYTNGSGYYNIWVNDMKGTDGQYLNIAPVFRNDWYDLTITSLTLPGSPKISIDPGQPIHPDTNVGITLTVRDWNKVNHNVNLQ